MNFLVHGKSLREGDILGSITLRYSRGFLETIMEFLSWYYSKGVEYYINSWLSSLRGVSHYFSIPLLLKTLFSPWKRLIVVDKSPGFNFQKKFEAFTFNMISRGIGAIVRFTLLWVGMVFILFSFLGGAVGLVFWLVLPFFGIGVYSKYQRQPANYIKDLLFRLKSSKASKIVTIFDNAAGQFVLGHTGLNLQDLIDNADKEKLSLQSLRAETYGEVIEKLLKYNVWNSDFFNKKKIKGEDLLLASSWWDKKQTEETKLGGDYFGRPGLALEMTFGYTPTLNQYSVDLSTPQSYSHRLIGRKNIVSRMERILSSGSNVILMGDPGVGKKTVVLEFAKKASNGQLGLKMTFKRVLEFDYNSLLSQSLDLNRKKTELALIFEEASLAGNIILMIRDIHRLTHSDVEGYDFTDIFEEYMEKGNLKIIAIATNSDYERFITPNLRLRKFLEKVEVTQPTKDEAMEILIESAQRWEGLTGMNIMVPTLREILIQSDRYVTEVPFPEKAIELLDAVITYCEQKRKNKLEIEDVNAVLAERTGVSFSRLSAQELKRLNEIEDIIHQKLINQDVAINLIGKTLRAKTIGVIKEDRPLGSFLFLGPTGVGKTETAKVLAKVYFGTTEAIQRFDMAEYSGSEGLERLIGSAGKNLPGALTTAIKNRPASLLLLDEIEKASKEIYNLFLALLDEGVITDAFGKRIIGRHLFVIGTSNAGAEFIRQSVQKGVRGEDLQKEVLNYVMEKELFSPEFINRFDGVVVYEPLRKEHLVKIAKLMLNDLSENLKVKGIGFTATEETYEKLATDGYEPAFGARPMKRLVNINLGDLISRAILSGEIKEGDKIELIPGAKKDEFLFKKITV